MPRGDFLPYGRHSLDEDDIAAVVQALRGSLLTTGPLVELFEIELAQHLGARNAVVCSSGTAALHLAALSLDLSPGDHAIVPAVTFLATANTIRLAGGEVIFADVDPTSGLMTAETFSATLEKHRGKSIRAVLPVHMAGQCTDSSAIAALARENRIEVIEDAAHSFGTTYQADGEMVPVGANRHSTMTCFSFHPVKTIAMGEGGAVTTADTALAGRLRCLRSHGMVRDSARHEFPEQARDANGAPNPWYYEMPEPGLNYRAPDILCALGLSQLRKLNRFVSKRRELVWHYQERLAPYAKALKPIESKPGCDAAWHLFIVLIDFPALGITRAELMRTLREAGIGTQVHYLPLHRQPYYSKRYGGISLPGADAYYARTLTLPLFPAMSTDDVDRVVDALLSACRIH